MTIPTVIGPTVIGPPKKPPSRRAQGMPTEAPTLTIHYKCPVCGWSAACDAYDGPPVCYGDEEHGHRAWMVALRIVENEGKPGPLADIMKLSGGWARSDAHRSKEP